MGVEFRLGHQDHKKVEDFLARKPRGVSAIVLDTKAAPLQSGAAEAARDAEVEVLFDPATDRLCDIGFDLTGLPYYPSRPYDIDALAADADARTRLVAGVIEAHPETVTLVTPPHFYVSDDRSAALNVDLAETARQHTDLPVRATLVLARAYGVKRAANLAAEYRDAGISRLELRLSPFGGEDESVAKIRSGFKIADAFRAVGLDVVLGFSGNVGQTAFALGHVSGYSVGVGMREQVNHARTISQQKRPPREPEPGEEDKKGGVAVAGIYLPGAAATLPRASGKDLLRHSDIRTKIGCRIGACGSSVAGPSIDPRAHYLHARAAEMTTLMDQPALAWRAKAETDRLRRAVEVRQLINDRYLPEGATPLKVRTLESLIDDIREERAARTA
jgi:hypothetical protein